MPLIKTGNKIKALSLQEIRSLFCYHLEHTDVMAKHDYFNVFEKTLQHLECFGFHTIKKIKVLELGCGQRYSFSLLCAACGAAVTAVDVNYVAPNSFPIFFYRTLKHNGFKRAIKSSARKLFFDKRYFDVLEYCFGEPLLHHRPQINFVIADATKPNYPLPSQEFDLILSNAVLEHIADVPSFAQEVERLLVNGGYFYGNIHNFYSLSGGHNMEWAYPESKPSTRVPPWDHIRENRFPAHVYLNRYKPSDYIDAFGMHLSLKLFEARDINHDPGGFEGKHFLTDEIYSELAAYPKDLLLTRGWCIICQKE